MNDQALFESVLIVEDEPAHGMLIRRVVATMSGDVIVAGSVGEAVKALRDHKPNLIITDLHLPDSNGVDHIETLVKEGDGCPVLMLTASTSIKDAVSAMQLGAADFIVKNFDDGFDDIFGLALRRLHGSELLKGEKRKIQSEMEALRMAIENGQDGMAVLNLKGEFLYQNSSLQTIIAKTNGNPETIFTALGDNIKGATKLHSDIKEKLENLAAGAVWSTEILINDDKDAAFELHLSVIASLPGNDNRAVVWVKDVSERKRRERFQKEILSTTTHDLKGPLGAIALCADMLQDMVPATEKAHQLITRINNSSRGALGLIDEFLSARRIQEGTFVLQPARQDIVPIISAVVDEYKAVAESRKVSLDYQKSGATEYACVDGLALTRVMGNLISNALKFTPAGGSVVVSSKIDDEALIVRVRDTGSGMEAPEVQRIFDRYRRLSKHATIQGTGLGLYVVKNIVTAHGGNIEVTSQPGQGSTFSLYFPAEPPINDRGQILCLDFA